MEQISNFVQNNKKVEQQLQTAIGKQKPLIASQTGVVEAEDKEQIYQKKIR
jgi:hypothetical protein